MATYCIGDIHGYYDEFRKMLELIEFSPDDMLHILGDIHDRGPKSAEMLMWAVDEAPDNVFFLRGNHEDMMFQSIRTSPGWMRIKGRDNPWRRNGGSATSRHVKKKTHTEWRCNNLMVWLISLPYYRKIEVGGKPFLLVHAGLNPDNIGVYPDTPPRNLRDVRDFDLPDGFGRQNNDDLVWIRDEWLTYDGEIPYPVIHGHSAFDEETARLFAADPTFSGSFGSIYRHHGNRFCVDCGISHKEAPYRLGCLRLDDFEEFYVPLGEGN